MTNFTKLTRWDADYYKTLPADDCIVCITEQEAYLLQEATRAMRWSATRWVGNIFGLDFDKIASELEYKLNERMTCTQLTQTMQNLQIQLTNLQNTLENSIDPSPAFDPAETTIADSFPDVESEAYSDALTVAMDTCDTAGKDALFGATRELVAYIHAVNIDALQKISQLGNISDQIDRLIAATPLGLLPLDEGFEYATFIIENLLEEYEATVDEALLEQTTCDLFCRFASNNCTVDMVDTANYFGQKLGTGFDAYLSTFASVLEFIALGTVTGDGIFYAFSLFQLVGAVLADHFFETNGAEHYLIRALTGMNSPDNDWTLLCDECPPFYRLWAWDFAYGMGDWVVDTYGVHDGNRVKGTLQGDGDANLYQIKHPFNPDWRIIAVKMYTERINGISNGSDDYSVFKMRPTADSNADSFNPIQGGFRPNGNDDRCNINPSAPFYFTGANQIWVSGSVSNTENSAMYLYKIEILFEDGFHKPSSTLTTDGTLCS